MNKTELVKAIAEKSELTVAESTKALNAFLETITETLKNGDDVVLTGFGTFKVAHRGERKTRNPQTGAELVVAATDVPVFKAGKALKDSIK